MTRHHALQSTLAFRRITDEAAFHHGNQVFSAGPGQNISTILNRHYLISPTLLACRRDCTIYFLDN
jgi:hypothetical protein